jgi:hypothetical protein
MWQSTQADPGDPTLWWWCAGVSNFAGKWQRAHTALGGAAVLRLCGSWQSLHVTPARYMRDCRNDPYS